MSGSQCLNCDSQVVLTQNFCANCGQPTRIHRFTLGHFFHEAFHAFTHADKGLLFLLKELALRPGVVAREYISGKRKKYYNPFTFFLILATFFVVSAGIQFSTSTNKKLALPPTISKIQDSRQREVAIARFTRGMEARAFFSKHGNIIAMLAVPFFAFYFWLIYLRRGYNYSEHLVANLMFVSFANLAFTLIVFPLQVLLKGNTFSGSITFVGLLLQLIYFVIAYKGFMQLRGFSANLRVIVATLVALVLWGMITTSAIAIYVYQNIHFYQFFKYI